MAGDWVKMRVNLRKHPKVIAMSRCLAADRAFMDWWSNPQRYTCHENVTEIVTFENVTRVTVCGLLEVWGAINTAIKDDDTVEYMELIDIDDIAGIPGFGEAMESVGWVSVVDEEHYKGLSFPNFREFNTPDSERKKGKSDAERAREYRQRKKAEAEQQQRHDRHGSSQGEEKRREENTTPQTPQGVDGYPEDFEEFWQRYPRKIGKGDAYKRWKKIRPGAELKARILWSLDQHKRSEQWQRENGRYIPNPATWLNQARWDDEPEAGAQTTAPPRPREFPE